MSSSNTFSATMRITATLAIMLSARVSGAQPPDLFLEYVNDFIWSGAGDGTTWQAPDNWTPPIGFEGEFPNDPGRMDTDEVDIVPVEGDNFSVNLSADLTVDISGSDVTVASVKLGGTGAPVTTDIMSGTGNLLVLENRELNDTMTNPGDPEADPPILPEPIYSFNQGNGLIWSTGTSGSNLVNRISANIKVNDNVDVEGDRDLHIFGNLVEGDRVDSAGNGLPSSFSSLLTGGAWLYIHGDLELAEFDEDTELDGTQDRPFFLHSDRGLVVPPDPQNPPDEELPRQGNVDMVGSFTGDGSVQIGMFQGNLLPLSTVILRGDSIGVDPMNPTFAGDVVVNRVNLVLDHDNALGGGEFRTGNPNQGFGFNFISTSDERNIGTDIEIAQWHTVRGASDVEHVDELGDHSIEFSGQVIQGNTRGWINLLPYNYQSSDGKTLTLSGPQYPVQGGDNEDPDRLYTIDGTGKTLITGGIHNHLAREVGLRSGNGHFRKRGSGTVVIDFDEAHTEDVPTDYSGDTRMEGGNLHFAANTDLPNPGTVGGSSAEILSTGGAVGVDEGVVSNGTFLAMLNNSSNPSFSPATNPPFFRTFSLGPQAIFSRYDYGGLMLAEDEYNQDLDFSGSLTSGLGRAANMSLAAWETGSEYTGTITPSATVLVNPNTYQLGGGSGTLTLPNVNQLTGNRDLLVKNGGEVEITNVNNYTGTTTIQGNFETSLTGAAKGNQPGATLFEDGVQLIEGSSYRGTTLTVTNLADGSSSLGNSNSDTANVLIQGSTLRYEAGEVSTSRLFTVGTAGATIDASGAGTLHFTNTGALGIDVAEDRLGITASDVPDNSNNEIFGIPSFSSGGTPVTFRTDDLVPGMVVREVGPNNLTANDSALTITNVASPHVIQIGEEDVDPDADPPDEAWPGFPSGTFVTNFDFGPAPARMLTLTGTNTGDNTLAPSVGDAADITEDSGAPGGNGSVGITKSGAGKWILANPNNTYTGDTIVEEGTLAAVSIGGGNLIVEEGGTIAPGMSTGTLAVGGDYTQMTGGTFQVEIDGISDFDVLDIAGDAVLQDGAIFDIVLGTSLNGGETFDILTANLITADVGMLSLAGAGGFEASLVGGTILQLAFTGGVGGLAGDYNEDGVVNAADYTVWRDALATGGSLANESATPGVVDQADYDFWKSRFGATSAAGNGASAAVPEPATAFLLLLGLTAVGWRRRRHN